MHPFRIFVALLLITAPAGAQEIEGRWAGTTSYATRVRTEVNIWRHDGRWTGTVSYTDPASQRRICAATLASVGGGSVLVRFTESGCGGGSLHVMRSEGRLRVERRNGAALPGRQEGALDRLGPADTRGVAAGPEPAETVHPTSAADLQVDPRGDTDTRRLVGWTGIAEDYLKPDIVSVQARLEGSELDLTVRFAPGTFDPQRTQVRFGIDADLDQETGTPRYAFAPGTDYEGNLLPTGPSDLSVHRGAERRIGQPVVTLLRDGMTARIPLDRVPPSGGGIRLWLGAMIMWQAPSGMRVTAGGFQDGFPGPDRPTSTFRVMSSGGAPGTDLDLSGELTDQDGLLSDGARYDEIVYRSRAGQQVIIDLISDDFDAALRIGRGRGGAWRELEYNDDGGDGTNSRLEFYNEQQGELVIRAGSFSPHGRGAYTLRVRSAAGRTALPSWVGTWELDEDLRGGGPAEILRFFDNGTGEYETRYWSGPARFTYARDGENRITLTGLPRGWTASAQRFSRGNIQLHVDRGNGSVGLLPFNRVDGPPASSASSAPERAPVGARTNPYVGMWRESFNNDGGTVEVFADGRAVLTIPGGGGGTYTLRYSRGSTEASLTGYPNGSASMRISETGTLFINYVTTSGSRGMRAYRRAAP